MNKVANWSAGSECSPPVGPLAKCLLKGKHLCDDVKGGSCMYEDIFTEYVRSQKLGVKEDI